MTIELDATRAEARRIYRQNIMDRIAANVTAAAVELPPQHEPGFDDPVVS